MLILGYLENTSPRQCWVIWARLAIVICIYLFTAFITSGQSEIDSLINIPIVINPGDEIASEFSDNTIYNVQNQLELAKSRKDTNETIQTLSQLGYIYSHRANYARSYQYFWDALLLADQLNDSVSVANLHEHIGWLYSYFDRKKESLNYFQSSLSINKKLIQSNKATLQKLISVYYGLTIFYRENNEAELSKQYLDSCYQVRFAAGQTPTNAKYLNAELGYYLLNKGEVNNAIRTLLPVVDHFKDTNPSYLTILFSMLGDAYKLKSNFNKSEAYYKASVELSKTLNSHSNYLPRVYDKMADLYAENRQYQKAYKYLEMAQKANEKLYDSRSPNNRPLLEISDKYREDKIEQNRLIQQQRLKHLEHQEKVNSLQRIILSISLIFILLSGYLYIRYLRIQHKNREELAKEKRLLEKTQNLELIELKNRELASSALQLIQKDEFFKEIKTHLFDSNEVNSKNTLKRLLKNATADSKQHWVEFESRFTEVNKTFYKNLLKKHPNLTNGERKLCALIKLDFSSKEIAQLMGISNESVHTQRYRLRKKLQLPREINLSLYLENLS